MSLMKNYILLLLLPLLACKLEQARTAAASDASSIPIRYQVNFDNVQHHELRISIRFQDLDQDTLVLRMP